MNSRTSSQWVSLSLQGRKRDRGTKNYSREPLTAFTPNAMAADPITLFTKWVPVRGARRQGGRPSR